MINHIEMEFKNLSLKDFIYFSVIQSIIQSETSEGRSNGENRLVFHAIEGIH